MVKQLKESLAEKLTSREFKYDFFRILFETYRDSSLTWHESVGGMS